MSTPENTTISVNDTTIEVNNQTITIDGKTINAEVLQEGEIIVAETIKTEEKLETNSQEADPEENLSEVIEEAVVEAEEDSIEEIVAEEIQKTPADTEVNQEDYTVKAENESEKSFSELNFLRMKLEEKDNELISLQEAHEQELQKYAAAVTEAQKTLERNLRHHQESIVLANEKIVKELLPVMTSFDSSMKYIKAETEKEVNIVNGFHLIYNDLLKTLANHGVQQITGLGEQADYTIHEVVQQISDAEKPAGEIVEVYRKGYKLGDKVILAAQVVVVQAKD